MHVNVWPIPTETDRTLLALAKLDRGDNEDDEVPDELMTVVWTYARPLLAGFHRTRRDPARNIRRCLRVPDGSGLLLLKAIATVDGHSPLPEWICRVNLLTPCGKMRTCLGWRLRLSPLDVACIAPDHSVVFAKSSGVYRYSSEWDQEELLLSGGRSRFFCLTAGTDCVYGLWGPFRIARLDMSGHNEVVCRTKTVPHCFAAYRSCSVGRDRLIMVLDLTPGRRSVVLWEGPGVWKKVTELGDCAAASVDVDHIRALAYVLAYMKDTSSWALWVVDLQCETCRGKFPIPHRRSAAPAAWHRVFARPDGGVWITGVGDDNFSRAGRAERSTEDEKVWGKLSTKCDDAGLSNCLGKEKQISDDFCPPCRKGLMDGEWLDTWEPVFI